MSVEPEFWANAHGSYNRTNQAGRDIHQTYLMGANPGLTMSARNMPPPSRHFRGRQEPIDWIKSRFLECGSAGDSTDNVVLLCGIAGVGKTQLALAFADSHRSDYESMYYINGESEITILTDVSSLLSDVRANVTANSELSAFCNLLSQRKNWLLVVDNAEQSNDLLKIMGLRTGHIVVTSRHASWIGVHLGNALAVEPLATIEAAELLCSLSGDVDASSAEKLAKELGELPLALTQAGYVARSRNLTLEGFLTFYKNRRLELLESSDGYFGHLPVGVTFSLALETALQRNSASLDLLGLVAYLAPENLPLVNFETVDGSQLPEPLNDAVTRLSARTAL